MLIQQPDSPADTLAGNFSRMAWLGVIDIPTASNCAGMKVWRRVRADEVSVDA